METQHEYRNDVDKFMDRIRVAINLRLESDKKTSIRLRQESDEMLRDAEYTLYEMIDNAMEDGARCGSVLPSRCTPEVAP